MTLYDLFKKYGAITKSQKSNYVYVDFMGKRACSVNFNPDTHTFIIMSGSELYECNTIREALGSMWYEVHKVIKHCMHMEYVALEAKYYRTKQVKFTIFDEEFETEWEEIKEWYRQNYQEFIDKKYKWGEKR